MGLADGIVSIIVGLALGVVFAVFGGPELLVPPGVVNGGGARGGGVHSLLWRSGGGSSSSNATSNAEPRAQSAATVARLEGGPVPATNQLSASISEQERQLSGALLYEEEGMDYFAAERFGMRDLDLSPATKAVQRVIYEHQFPKDGCAGKKFITSQWTGGIGSQMHIATYHLHIGLELGRIFLWEPDAGAQYTDRNTCGDARNWLCFFKNPSSCTLEDAKAPGADVLRARSFFVQAAAQNGFNENFIPSKVKHLYLALRPKPTENDFKFWWRGQAAAFLLRFNSRTIAALKELRLAPRALLSAPAVDGQGVNQSDPRVMVALDQVSSFPLPQGTVSMHIRHGDKGIEMTLIPMMRFLTAAEDLFRWQPNTLSRRSFISTEDPSAIDEAKGVVAGTVTAPGRDNKVLLPSQLSSWVHTYYDVPRHNSNGQQQLARLGLPAGQLTRIWFLQLTLALECDAWVGTRNSNWNRLLDELRCTWLPKCRLPYVEVGMEKDWQTNGWR